jgi:hypothetical protein
MEVTSAMFWTLYFNFERIEVCPLENGKLLVRVGRKVLDLNSKTAVLPGKTSPAYVLTGKGAFLWPFPITPC